MNANPLKHKPVFFKKIPSDDKTAPNAVLLRNMGELNGKEIVEIEWHGERWLVTRGEILFHDEALRVTAEKYHAKISAAVEPKQTRIALAKRLEMSTSTLRKRLAFIKKYLPAAAAL